MSKISYSYRLVYPYRTQRRRGANRAHIVQCEHFPPGMGPHAQKQVLCGAMTGSGVDGRPARTTCPACRREFARILAAAVTLIQDKNLVTCPDGCTRPGGLPVLCDPVYDSGEGAPYATGNFRCPLCRREHAPEQET